jgi:PAS domain S-box-containing protein
MSETQSNWSGSGPLAVLQAENETLQREVARRRRAEEALRASEELHRITLENISDAVFLTDDAGALRFVCPNVAVIFGYSQEETRALGRIGRLLGPELYDVTELDAAQELRNIERTVRNKHGDEKTLLVHVKRVSISDATVLFSCRDVTDRNQAETARREQAAALRRSEERYRDIVEDQTELICRFLPDGTLTFVNGAYGRYFRRNPEDLVGETFWPLIPADAHEASRRFLATITREHPVATIEHPVLTPDGETRWQQWTDRGIFDEQGLLVEFQAVGRDITDRRRAEAEIVAAHDEIKRLKDQLHADNIYLREEIRLKYNYDEIIGQCEAIRRVLHHVEQVAAARATVLLMGETGTGKELLARAIHSRSPRAARPMVTLNCAALPASLIESELFGREKGAYTGALTRQIGRFEQADGSTLFLDEIGELPLELQVKLLRVLQEGQFERLGSTVTHRADVRIIAATNRDLARQVAQGTFREDLYYRLNVFPIRVPALRDRPEDIPLLVWGFVQEFSRSMGKSVDQISRHTMDALQRHSWPGNIRELRNVVERAMIVAQGPALHIELPQQPGDAVHSLHEDLTLDEVQRRHILSVLERTGWRVSGHGGAAEVLGLKPTTLESRMAKLGIHREMRHDTSGNSRNAGNGHPRRAP